MLLKLSRNDVFFKLLLDIGIVILPNLDNALNIPVNRFCEHLLNRHTAFSLIDQLEGSVVIIVLYFAKQDKLLSVILARVEHHDRYIINHLMQIVEYLV